LTEEFEKVDAEMRRAQEKKAELLGHIDDLVKEKERLTRDVERARRLVTQKEAQYFGPLAWLRACPGSTWRHRRPASSRSACPT
jgi:hypothetical protein